MGCRRYRKTKQRKQSTAIFKGGCIPAENELYTCEKKREMIDSPRLRAQKDKRITTVLAENTDKPDALLLRCLPGRSRDRGEPEIAKNE